MYSQNAWSTLIHTGASFTCPDLMYAPVKESYLGAMTARQFGDTVVETVVNNAVMVVTVVVNNVGPGSGKTFVQEKPSPW